MGHDRRQGLEIVGDELGTTGRLGDDGQFLPEAPSGEVRNGRPLDELLRRRLSVMPVRLSTSTKSNWSSQSARIASNAAPRSWSS